MLLGDRPVERLEQDSWFDRPGGRTDGPARVNMIGMAHATDEAVSDDCRLAEGKLLEVDQRGFDRMDRALLLALIDKFGGGPVGVETLAAAIGEEADTIEDVYEPFLIQEGFLNRTPKGRVATPLAYGHFGRAARAARAAGEAVRLMGDLGKMLMMLGVIAFVLGAGLVLVGKLPWFGRLPGDIVVERGPVTFYFPIVTCIVVSIVLSLLFWLFRR